MITYGITYMHLLVLLCRLNMKYAVFHCDDEGHSKLKVQLTHMETESNVYWTVHHCNS